MDFTEEIKLQTKAALEQLLEEANLKSGDIFVVGCSSSEVAGKRIGTASACDIGKAIFEVLYAELSQKGIYLAAQCCEHLNRALITEDECAKKYFLTQVNAVPQLKAGGSFATAAYNGFKAPVAVESLRSMAHAGMDIGDTIIGMHLRPVVVPVRTEITEIGKGRLVCARTRAKYIGGERAVYDKLLG